MTFFWSEIHFTHTFFNNKKKAANSQKKLFPLFGGKPEN